MATPFRMATPFLALLLLLIMCVIFRRYSSPEMGDFQKRLINTVNARCAAFVRYVESDRELANDPRMVRLLSRFRSGQILPMLPGRGAGFTRDKGREIRVCVPDDGDINTAMFVTLHELAHVLTPDNGHTAGFWENFAFVLGAAVKAGVYSPQRFSRETPGSYCGQSITYQPLDNMGARPRLDAGRRLRRENFVNYWHRSAPWMQ